MDISKYLPSITFMIYIEIMLFIFFIIQLISPTAIELPLFYYWHYEGIFNGFLSSWPIYLWSFTITLLSLIFVSQDTLKNKNILYATFASDESSLFRCFIVSLLIGITEEINYRWLFFYSNIVSTKITNFCSFGLCRFFYLNIEAPFINIIFFNNLKWLLYDQVHWSIGSAALIVNGKFRDGHLYLGLFGWYNSWCIGFFFFWIMMNYGLPAAMCSHAFYDFIIFFMYYIHGIICRQRKSHYITKTSTSYPNLKETV
ncbi:unnamed protein product [Adineta steineri]|uniref:CPBP family intramembrane metalloprotease n=1 Tax=Adineta steineri TaxID=433720 RepID=A0A815NLJ9_9BILA|nr:unnamed protein product [Adineta steineri]